MWNREVQEEDAVASSFFCGNGSLSYIELDGSEGERM
ncbi:hypothetical protein protein [Bacillus cereus G9241]|nr:hypothetical protein protein [Bacillus cereus G9241]